MLRLVNIEEILLSESTNVVRFAPFAAKMGAAGMPELVIRLFHYYYNQLLAGATGYISSDDAQPVRALPDYEALDDRYAEAGTAPLDRVVMLKLNGGLGTSMGMEGPKSLVEVKDGLSFLDITVKQVAALRAATGARLPLVLMNSFNTQAATLAAMQRYPDFVQDVPHEFMQHRVPKIWKDTLRPVTWPPDRNKEWCPPGHGDLYAAIVTSGMLRQLLNRGYEYAFVSNVDNLGAVLDARILGYFAEERLPFLMEVAHRTGADRKGGHLAQRSDGQLILRELGQCPPHEIDAFQDVEFYRYFNTNNLWIHLPTLQEMLYERHEVLGLPLIRNEKPVDPTQPASRRVFQLETAMGSAIAVFAGAQAMRVPRIRFVPVKKNNDLLLLWSDVYRLNEAYHLELAAGRKVGPPRRPPLITLDERYYGLIDDLRLRFPYGAPSLLQCESLRVDGDIVFGRHVILEGHVHLINEGSRPWPLPDGARLSGVHRMT